MIKNEAKRGERIPKIFRRVFFVRKPFTNSNAIPRKYRNIPRNAMLFMVVTMPCMNETTDCMILRLWNITKAKQINEQERFTTGTTMLKYGRNALEESVFVRLIKKPTSCTTAAKKIIGRS